MSLSKGWVGLGRPERCGVVLEQPAAVAFFLFGLVAESEMASSAQDPSGGDRRAGIAEPTLLTFEPNGVEPPKAGPKVPP